MFRGRRGRRLGPHLLLAGAARSARTWRALGASRRRDALLLPWHWSLALSRRRGALVLARHSALLGLRRHRRPLRRRQRALGRRYSCRT